MKVHSKPKSNQIREKQFQKYLLKSLSEFEHINNTYTLSNEEFLNPFLEIREIEKLILSEKYLSDGKKKSILHVLGELPDRIRVAERCNLVSVDFMIVSSNGIKHYIEFHEEQHKKLTVSRLTTVYDVDFNKFLIPRFVQRILKDIWRLQNLPNFRIVWFDWFAINPNYEIGKILGEQKVEFAIEGRFTFIGLLS